MESRRPEPERLFEQADHWFQRTRAALLGSLPCAKGCTHCCIGPFSITLLDVEQIQAGLSHLSTAARQQIESTAQEQTNAIQHSASDLFQGSPFLDRLDYCHIDFLVEQFAHLPCPALHADGSCQIYAYRPLTCRMMGIPLEEKGEVQGACQVQTFIPLKQVTKIFRQEEDVLADRERYLLDSLREEKPWLGEEVLLPFGFIPNLLSKMPSHYDSQEEA